MSRRPNLVYQERLVVPHQHPQVTANQTYEVYLTPLDRPALIDRVLYESDAGLAADDTNYVVLNVLNGATVAASWSTKLTGGNGALVAKSLEAFINGALANRSVPANTKIKLQVVVTGAPTLPLANLKVDLRLL